MNLYLLERRECPNYPVYDCVDGFVIRAPTISEARNLAEDNSADEGPAVWQDQTRSACILLATDCEGTLDIVLRDFHAG